jgi:hypothetical protein
LIDAHRGAFEYDWRTRFNASLDAIGESMTWGEAIRLTRFLTNDTASAVGAAVAELDRPTSREALILMDLYDVYVHIAWLKAGGKGQRPKPYPRPWRPITTRRTAPDARLTQDEIIAALRAAGHTARLPGEG